VCVSLPSCSALASFQLYCTCWSSETASIGLARLNDYASVTQGLEFVSGLALANCQDLLPMLQWNAAHGIKLMRWTKRSACDAFTLLKLFRLPNVSSRIQQCGC
jgi:UV-endonuclease UvdE